MRFRKLDSYLHSTLLFSGPLLKVSLLVSAGFAWKNSRMISEKHKKSSSWNENLCTSKVQLDGIIMPYSLLYMMLFCVITVNVIYGSQSIFRLNLTGYFQYLISLIWNLPNNFQFTLLDLLSWLVIIKKKSKINQSSIRSGL